MRILAFLLCTMIVAASSCEKKECGCVPPPHTEMTWKITSRYGGVSGGEIPLTTAEKEHTLTLRSDGSFTCRNRTTGHTINGGLIYTEIATIYGSKTRITFSSSLPILTDEYVILLEKNNSMILFGDNVVDGYTTRMEKAN